MLSIEDIYDDFRTGDLAYLEAIEAVVTHCGEAPKDAERIVNEWVERLENAEPQDPPGWEGGFAANH